MKVVFKTKTPFYYYFDPRKWLAVIMWQLKKLVDWYHRGDIDEITYCEQIIFRRTQCVGCNNSGKSQCCNCDFNGLIKQRDRECTFLMWPKMMGREEWQEYKFLNNINIKI